MLSLSYIENLQARLADLAAGEQKKIAQVAEVISGSLMNDGLLHVFGCGHSAALVSEAFYRAGGLVPVNPIYETSLMLNEGAVKSSMLERTHGYARHILDNYETRPGEVLIIFSNSGVNPMPVEMAIEAKAKGLVVVAVTSMEYRNEKSRHEGGKKLYEIADFVIDTKIPLGDGLTELTEGRTIAPGSTVICAAVMNMLVCEIGEIYVRAGKTPPFFISGNIEGGMDHNKSYIEKYRSRIKSL